MKRRSPPGQAGLKLASCHAHAMATLRYYLTEGSIKMPPSGSIQAWGKTSKTGTGGKKVLKKPGSHVGKGSAMKASGSTENKKRMLKKPASSTNKRARVA